MKKKLITKVLGSVLCAAMLLGTVGCGASDGKTAETAKDTVQESESTEQTTPVSYTHLDVYKRQVHYRRPRLQHDRGSGGSGRCG